jgi:vancomycin resistance protein YoaR
MKRIWGVLVPAALLGATAGVALGGTRALLPGAGEVARGLRAGGQPIGSDRALPDAVNQVAGETLARRVTFTHGGDPVLESSLADLGAQVDIGELARRLGTVGREGGLWARLDDALQARRGRIDVPIPVSLPIDELAARLERLKEERDEAPRSAKLDLATRKAAGDAPGRYVDIYAAVAAIDRMLAAPSGEAVTIALPELVVAPTASAEVVTAIDTSKVLARYETRFGYLGGQANRARNVARAAEQMEGVVIMPGEIVSFNANVGPRSAENGFFPAPEIFKGEMREGIGGGTCQVAGTLHAAALFAGLDLVERANHSRPSGYLRLGLDATVVYPVVDLKLRNPYEFPVVMHATIDKGTLVFELLGRDQPATVDLRTDTIGIAEFKRKIEETSWLPAGKIIKKQKGIRGYSIRKTRTIVLKDGVERVEVTTDVYPPTFEIYLVPPGTDPDEALPPLGETAQVG